VVLGTAGWLALVLAAVLIVPPLVHPELTGAELGALAPEQRIPLQQEQGSLQNDVRASLVQGAVGLLALAGAGVGVYVGLRQLHLTREGQITDRFLRAVDQLGSDKVEIRFGGIFAMERIAKDSPPDRSAITEVLSAHVRRSLPSSKIRKGHIPELHDRAPDAQAALTVLCRSPLSAERAAPGAEPLKLSRTDLRRADLRGAQLQRANLWSARLEGADLRGAHLEGAILANADFGLFEAENPAYRRGADLRGADLTGANMKHAIALDVALTEGTIGLD
jgi:Pentapeptide repeats (8 copies)